MRLKKVLKSITEHSHNIGYVLQPLLSCGFLIFKRKQIALASLAQWIECQPVKQVVVG